MVKVRLGREVTLLLVLGLAVLLPFAIWLAYLTGVIRSFGWAFRWF